jgi:peptide deformylase
MICKIIKDTLLLQRVSEPATSSDLYIATNLIDTLLDNKKTCVGLAANMIGYNKTILVYLDKNDNPNVLINPKVIYKDKTYETEEGCLSLNGVRKCVRYDVLTVKYYDLNFKEKTKTFRGFIAEIIEHEMDHFDGILI